MNCRECGGDGCDCCDEGHATCDQRGCSDQATESFDFEETGGPSDWMACAYHARKIRASLQRAALREEI